MDVKQVAVATEEMPVRTNFTATETEQLQSELIARKIELSNLREELDSIKALIYLLKSQIRK
jgi:hypothetical protein